MSREISDSEREDLSAAVSGQYAVEPLVYTQVKDYNTFLAEYAFEGGDIILHFYRTPEYKDNTAYWLNIFPMALDPVARIVFNATAPRLRAAYTEEMDSWWLRANDYEYIIDRKALVLHFLETLDHTLDTLI
jgi:hypothetical protein